MINLFLRQNARLSPRRSGEPHCEIVLAELSLIGWPIPQIKSLGVSSRAWKSYHQFLGILSGNPVQTPEPHILLWNLLQWSSGWTLFYSKAFEDANCTEVVPWRQCKRAFPSWEYREDTWQVTLPGFLPWGNCSGTKTCKCCRENCPSSRFDLLPQNRGTE